MKTGMEILQKRAAGASVELGTEIDEATFRTLGLPMVVACAGCRMTMAMPSALVDERGYTWCRECAGPDAEAGQIGQAAARYRDAKDRLTALQIAAGNARQEWLSLPEGSPEARVAYREWRAAVAQVDEARREAERAERELAELRTFERVAREAGLVE